MQWVSKRSLKDENGNNLEVTVPAPVSGFGFDRVLSALPLVPHFRERRRISTETACPRC
jgi:hypothetical protein